MKVLGELGIVRELTGRKRNRAFVYNPYLALFCKARDRSDVIIGPSPDTHRPDNVCRPAGTGPCSPA